ncbi:MAG: hypothetical protein IPL62_17100 [Caulobacteraceae bacterium]|nr:hypothetical protein [Caulobacteraceae bacterium]
MLPIQLMLLSAIDAPATRIVSTTVTENGYHLDRATKTLDFASADIIAGPCDLPTSTVPGILVGKRTRRRAAGQAAFTSLLRQHPAQWRCVEAVCLACGLGTRT